MSVSIGVVCYQCRRRVTYSRSNTAVMTTLNQVHDPMSRCRCDMLAAHVGMYVVQVQEQAVQRGRGVYQCVCGDYSGKVRTGMRREVERSK